jgi:hypothetical protein
MSTGVGEVGVVGVPSEQALRQAILMSDPEFQRLLKLMTESPAKTQLFVAEAVLVVLLFLFRTWKGPQCRTIPRRLWFQFWTLALYLALAGYVLPRVFLGSDYDRFLRMIRPLAGW